MKRGRIMDDHNRICTAHQDRHGPPLRAVLAIIVLAQFTCSCGDGIQNSGHTVVQGHVEILGNGMLTAHFADNSPLAEYDNHPEGLNGIARLRHYSRPDRDIFVPFLAGLNYEITTLKGVTDCTWEETAEPRFSPMEIRRLDDRSVELHQPATIRKEIEAFLWYTLVDDRPAIDFDFLFQLHKAPEPSPGGLDFSALFASYMFDPEDPHLYFVGHTLLNPHSRWLRANADHHGEFWVEEADGSTRCCFYTIDRPYLAGIVDSFLFMIMLYPDNRFGFWYSPNGNMELGYRTPAWDLSVTFDTVPGPPYSANVQGRMLLLPNGTLDDAEQEYIDWRDGAIERL